MPFRASVRASYDAALSIPGHAGGSGRTHGHGYQVEAILESEGTDSSGFVADFERIQAELDRVAGELDHRLLNELEPFRERAPSAEHQARYFYERLVTWVEESLAPGVRLARVRVIQRPDAWAEYEP